MSVPIYDTVAHERHHRDIADPGCPMCQAMLRHPAGENLAARREAEQHQDFEAQAQAVVDQADRAVLRRRLWIFTIAAAVFLTAGIVLTVVVDPPAAKILSALVALAGIAYGVAAWDLHRRGERR